MRSHYSPSLLQRWLRFNFVGLIGVGVQLAILEWLTAALHRDYRVATLLAVEAAVLHNFWWHLRYTWRDRRLSSVRLVLRRLFEFHLSNGALSLAGSLTLMTLLVGRAGLPVLAANVVSIVACSFVNFLLAEVVIFRTASRTRRGRKKNRCPKPGFTGLHLLPFEGEHG